MQTTIISEVLILTVDLKKNNKSFKSVLPIYNDRGGEKQISTTWKQGCALCNS